MKKLLSLFLALGLVLSLAACAGRPEPTEPGGSLPQETAAQAAYPLTVTDQAGRSVTIEKEPTRIVSGYYISSSALLALGLGDRLVGIEAKAGQRPIYRRSAPALLDLPDVGSAKNFDLEGCAALEPALVILPAKLKDAAETLEGLGIPTLLVNPESRESLREMIAMLGFATGRNEQAIALLEAIRDREDALTRVLADAEKPTVYLAGNSDLLTTAGGAMYQSDLIGLAGGVNVASALPDSYWAGVSYEQLLAWNPQYIILASDGDYSPADVLADPNLADCDAVKNGNVYQIPGDAEAWDSPVPGGFLGAWWLASVLHPDLVSEAAWRQTADAFYGTFYGFTYSES